MKTELKNINPHIRFAQQLVLSQNGNFVHVGDCRIFYILSGSGEIAISENSYSLTENSLFFCREKSVYSITSDKLTLISLNFDLNQENSLHTEPYSPVPVNEHKKNAGITADGYLINSHIFISDAKTYLGAIKSIVSEFDMQRIYFREKCSGILKNLITDIARDLTLTTDHSAHAVEKAIDFINNNFSEEITNKEIAALTGYHEYHLNRLFIKHTNQSLHQYLLTRRLNEAKKLLLGTDLSLAEIAEQSGFNSSSHFSSYFKLKCGITPYSYRNCYRKEI